MTMVRRDKVRTVQPAKHASLLHATVSAGVLLKQMMSVKAQDKRKATPTHGNPAAEGGGLCCGPSIGLPRSQNVPSAREG